MQRPRSQTSNVALIAVNTAFVARTCQQNKWDHKLSFAENGRHLLFEPFVTLADRQDFGQVLVGRERRQRARQLQ